MTMINTNVGIYFAQMAAAKGAITLEGKGMKHSSGKSMRKVWALNLGLKPTTKGEEVIAELQRRMDAIVALKTDPSHKNIAILNGFAEANGDDGTFKYACMVNGALQISDDTYFSEKEMWQACCIEQELLAPESGGQNG